MLYPFYTAVFWIANAVPRKAGYVIAAIAARLYYYMAREEQKILRENLKVILGENTAPGVIEAHVRGIFRNFAKYLADFFRLSRMNRKDAILRDVKVENAHYVDDSLAEGNGVIALSAHLGNWELGGAAVAALGYPISAVVLEHGDERINRLFVQQRVDSRVKVIPLGMALKRCFKVLRSNEVLAIVGDKDYTGSFKYVDFFGRQACLPKGPAVFSLKTNAPIVLCFLVREKDDSYRLVFEKPIKYRSTGNEEKDIKNVMRMYLGVFERYIREYPDQWYAFHRVWKQEPTIQ